MRPTIGRIIHYRLSSDDAEEINRRRVAGVGHQHYQNNEWPEGAQAHVGNQVSEGIIVPMIVAAVFDGADEENRVNGQAFLDGSDSFWVTSADEGTEPGQWSWPPRA